MITSFALLFRKKNHVEGNIAMSLDLRVEFLLKTESGYLRDAEVT